MILSLFFAAGITFAAAVGDQVELKATHQSGIPFHQQPHGTNDFQRIPDGTRAHVIDVAKGGQWLKLSLPDGRTGWVTSRYVSSPTTSAPSPGTSPTAPRPQRTEESTVTHVADGDTITVAQFIGVCRRSKWSKHFTNSPFLALLAMVGAHAACKISSACSPAFLCRMCRRPGKPPRSPGKLILLMPRNTRR